MHLAFEFVTKFASSQTHLHQNFSSFTIKPFLFGTPAAKAVFQFLVDI